MCHSASNQSVTRRTNANDSLMFVRAMRDRISINSSKEILLPPLLISYDAAAELLFAIHLLSFYTREARQSVNPGTAQSLVHVSVVRSHSFHCFA